MAVRMSEALWMGLSKEKGSISGWMARSMSASSGMDACREKAYSKRPKIHISRANSG